MEPLLTPHSTSARPAAIPPIRLVTEANETGRRALQVTTLPRRLRRGTGGPAFRCRHSQLLAKPGIDEGNTEWTLDEAVLAECAQKNKNDRLPLLGTIVS